MPFAARISLPLPQMFPKLAIGPTHAATANAPENVCVGPVGELPPFKPPPLPAVSVSSICDAQIVTPETPT